ncbi:MAG: virulence protein RhuM/Fic/DOC family protein [Candidatus Paceibacterota bacterium]
MKKNNIIIYQAKSGALEFKSDLKEDTIWASQIQIAEAFKVNVRTVNEHIINIYKTKELFKKGTIRKFRIVQKEGNREISRDIQHYNLDIILSVGYRVNSKKATKFRQWATKTLKDHLVKGYTINRKRIDKNYLEFLRSVEEVKKLLPQGNTLSTKDTLELIKFFAGTWLSLEAYDKSTFSKQGLTKKQVKITADELENAIVDLRHNLISQKETTDIFAQEKSTGSIAGIVGNVFQGFNGKNLYPTVEEKAAHLLYFIVKNHPFIDGNKRSGAFAFVWFLNKAGILNRDSFTPEALTALTILVAESNPSDKEKVVGLILNLLR